MRIRKDMLTMKNVKTINRQINKFMWSAFVALTACMMSTIIAFADDPPASNGDSASTIWNTVIDTICPYIIALGGVVCLIGGVNWALGFKSEDSDAQVRGIRTLIAGVAVSGVVLATQSLVKL